MKKILIIILLFISSAVNSQDKFVKEVLDYTVNSITVQGVYMQNLSDYHFIFPGYYGGYISYSKLFQSGFSIDVRAGYWTATKTDTTQDYSSDVFPIHVGGRYYFTNTSIKPYISFMNGINIISEEIPPNTVLDTASGIRVRYAFQVGTGIKYFFTKQVYLDVNANYNNSFYYPNSMMTGWEYNAGVGITLPK
ncbi:MAG TPA: hypothetical protein VK004_06470 [Ignavibacteria bacterium]|nr:hypothetical protein [Ignavibacteria bacterium]